MAAANEGGIQAIFKLSARPQLEIVKKHDETIDIEDVGLGTRVYIANCTNCQLVLKKKSANVLIENCQDLVVTVSAGLVSGTLEVFKSSKISIKINPDIKIPTITADSTTGLQIILMQNEQQLESLYFHQSSDLTINVQGCDVEKKEYVAIPPADSPDNLQFVSNWVNTDGAVQLVTEKVVREGVFPYAETALKEAREKDRQNAEKAFKTLEKEFFKAIKKK